MSSEPRDSETEQTNNNVVVALMGQKIGYIQKDIAEIKATLLVAGYVSKDQLSEITRNIDERFTRVENRVTGIYRYGGTVLALFTAALVTAFLKLVLRF